MTRKQEVDAESAESEEQALAEQHHHEQDPEYVRTALGAGVHDPAKAVERCRRHVDAIEEGLEATRALLADLAERHHLDSLGSDVELKGMAGNYRKAKARLRYAEAALDQAEQEWRTSVFTADRVEES